MRRAWLGRKERAIALLVVTALMTDNEANAGGATALVVENGQAQKRRRRARPGTGHVVDATEITAGNR